MFLQMPFVLLLVMAIGGIHQSEASLLPVHPKFRIPLPIKLSTPPPMVNSNLTFTSPSEFAKDCLSGIGSIVDYCQDKANKHWDPTRLNTSDSTTWETCCALYEELDCYVQNAYTFCPTSTRQGELLAMLKYCPLLIGFSF